jgi:hypothetical protein
MNERERSVVLKKAFDDALASPLSCLVLDNLERARPALASPSRLTIPDAPEKLRRAYLNRHQREDGRNGRR